MAEILVDKIRNAILNHGETADIDHHRAMLIIIMPKVRNTRCENEVSDGLSQTLRQVKQLVRQFFLVLEIEERSLFIVFNRND